MAFQKHNLKLIDSQLEKFVSSELSETTENLRQLVLDSPTQLTRTVMKLDLTKLQLKFSKERDFICLAILSWYFPEEIRFLFQMELEDTWKTQSREVKEVLLTSKDYALTWLICESHWNESDFFGNVMNKSFAKLFRLTEFKRISQKKVPRYSGYCRGYQDTNRGVPSSLRKEHWAKSSVVEEIQRQVEFEKRRSYLIWNIQVDLEELRDDVLADIVAIR